MTAPPPAQPAANTEPSIGTLAADASNALSTMVRGEIQLAKAELSISVKNVGVGIALFGAAAVLLVFSLTFGFIALAEGLVAIGLWRWLAYLIVFAFFVLVAVLLIIIGVRKVKRVKSPEKTINAAKQAAEVLKHPGQHTA